MDDLLRQTLHTALVEALGLQPWASGSCAEDVDEPAVRQQTQIAVKYIASVKECYL